MRKRTTIGGVWLRIGGVRHVPRRRADEAGAQGWGQGPFSGFFYDPAPRSRGFDRMRRNEPRRERIASQRIPAPSIRSDAADTGTPAKAGAASALVAVVSLRSQSITVWDQSGPVLRSRVSTGQSGHATPTGLFSVIQKNRYHESNIYSGAPMPWMHRITWSGIALHAGVVPNYPASHGCIRLPYDAAPKLWAMSRIGMRVVVAPDDIAMQTVLHEALPQPKLVTVGELEELSQGLHGIAREVGRLVPAAATPERLFNPIEVAQRLKKEASAAVEVRRRAAREALLVSTQASAEANAAAEELRAARAELAAAEAASRALAVQTAATTEEARTPDEIAAVEAAQRRLRDAGDRYRAAVAADAEKNPPAFAAARAAREAEIAAEAAPDQAREVARRLEPVSILVSGKEGLVFVRQGFESVLDAKIEIDDPLEPLGTHVFTAMAPAADGARLDWSALTMPSAYGDSGGDAIAALQRITFPANVRDEIARRVWTGASLIITDHGISNETGRGTDFVILTK